MIRVPGDEDEDPPPRPPEWPYAIPCLAIILAALMMWWLWKVS